MVLPPTVETVGFFTTICMNDINELRRLQSLPLDEKITLTKLRIQEWYEHWGGGQYLYHSAEVKIQQYY